MTKKICAKNGKITSIKINESKDKQKFVCFVEFEEKNSVVSCLTQFQKEAASSGRRGLTR